MNFSTRTTRPGVTHFPEVVFFGGHDDALLSNPFFPDVDAFSILRNTVFLVAFENSDIQAVHRNLIHFCKQFPGPAYGFFFKVIAKRPVAKHFKHGVVVGINTYFF